MRPTYYRHLFNTLNTVMISHQSPFSTLQRPHRHLHDIHARRTRAHSSLQPLASERVHPPCTMPPQIFACARTHVLSVYGQVWRADRYFFNLVAIIQTCRHTSTHSEFLFDHMEIHGGCFPRNKVLSVTLQHGRRKVRFTGDFGEQALSISATISLLSCSEVLQE